jgi:hypothetical protein
MEFQQAQSDTAIIFCFTRCHAELVEAFVLKAYIYLCKTLMF